MPPSHLLLAAVGTTPATVTEAVYALAIKRGVRLGAVRLLTTARIRDFLCGEMDAALAAMRRHYPNAKARIPASAEWRAFTLPSGSQPDDIRTTEDNDALANWMVREVAAAAECTGTIHASLAGGRKTMSYTLGAAMQLAARPQDKLYHVLVDPRFEFPGFLYPGPARGVLTVADRSGADVDTFAAAVDLAEVPFVPLRGLLRGLPPDVSTLSYSILVARATDSLSADLLPVAVRVRHGKPAIVFGGAKGAPCVELDFRDTSNKDFLFYSWLIWRAHRGLEPERLTDQDKFAELAADYAQWRERLGADPRPVRGVVAAWLEKSANDRVEIVREDWYKGFFAESPSRFAKRLAEAFAKSAPGHDAAKYGFVTVSKGTYTIPFPPDAITIDIPKAGGGQR